MTILLATKRDSFAILAAERMESRPGSAPKILGPKLICQRTKLPLAFGLAGPSSWLPALMKEGLPTLNLLEDLATEVRSRDELVLRTIANRVVGKLQPGYAEMKTDMVVAIALCKDGKADIGFQPIGSQTDLWEGRLRPLFPPSLDSFYSLKRCRSIHDRRIRRAATAIQVVCRFVAEGIAHHESLVAEIDRLCGGPVDVVLVDEQGARFVDCPSSNAA